MNANYQITQGANFQGSTVIVVTNWHSINEVGLFSYESMEAFEKNLPSVVSSVVAVFILKSKK